MICTSDTPTKQVSRSDTGRERKIALKEVKAEDEKLLNDTVL